MSNLKVKICGMKYNNNIRDIAVLKPDYMGFILYPFSPRYAGDRLTKSFIQKLPVSMKKVGVFVNQRTTAIMRRMDEFGFDYAQLHGDETLADIKRLHKQGYKIIKVFRVDPKFDFEQTKEYEPYSAFFLFDTKGEKYGGTGKKWDWSKLKEYAGTTPFFLSGGIGPDDVHTIKELNIPMLHSVDVNSHFESDPGRKERDLLKPFVTSVRG